MGYYYQMRNFCTECKKFIEYNVYEQSMEKYHVPLCTECQKTFHQRAHKASPEAEHLFQALLKRGVQAELEKYEDRMTVDIAIPAAMVNIEVSGTHRPGNSQRELDDLKRSYRAFQKGFLTLKIPPGLVKSNLDETAQFITDFLKESHL